MKENKKAYIVPICCFVIIVGCIFHIIPYFYNRSLWVDEATLASSIATRGLGDLVASPLDFGQSAPIGFLFLVKIITILFGVGAFQLRILSLLSFFAGTFFLYKIFKANGSVEYPIVYPALFSVMPTYIYYTNEFKPYMFEAFITILAIYLYTLFSENKLKFRHLCVLYSVLIWFSFSSCFYIAGVMIVCCMKKLIYAVKTKNIKSIVEIMPALPVLISFILYYILWLSSTESNAAAKGFWDMLKFPLVPTSLSDIKLIFTMLQIALVVCFPKILVIAFGLLGIYRVCLWIKKRNIAETDITILLSVVLLLIASSLGYYPIETRLLLFIGPMMIVILSEPFEAICGKANTKPKRAFLLIFLSITGASILYSCVKNVVPYGVYKSGEEVSANMSYLQENLTENDHIYVRRNALSMFLFETDYKYGNYDTTKDVPVEIENIIFGQDTINVFYNGLDSIDRAVNYEALNEDVGLIAKYDSVYIWTSHENAEKKEDTQELLSLLRNSGKVEIVSCDHDTYLYRYTKE